MVLLELLKLQERRIEARGEFIEFLYEHLGNLNVIDKELIKVLRKELADTYHRTDGKPHPEASKIGYYVGTNSTVDEEPARNPSQVMKEIMDNNSKVVAVVIKYGEKQVCAFASRLKVFGRNGSKDETDDIHIIVSPDFFNIVGPAEEYEKSVTKERTKTAPAVRGRRTYTTKEIEGHTVQNLLKGIGASTKFYGDVALNSANVKKVLSFIFDNAKANNMKVSMLSINRDEKRKPTGVERSNARFGRIPFMVAKSLKHYSSKEKLEYSNYTEKLLKSLDLRLSKWRSEKADKQARKFSSHEELIKHVVEEGFPEKVNFMGYVYDKGRVEIDWNDIELKSKDMHSGHKKTNPRSLQDHITYNIDRKTPSFKELQTQMKELMGGIPDEDPDDEHVIEAREQFINAYMRKYKKLVPPGNFMIHMSLVGGVIKPTNISISEDNDWVPMPE